MFTGERINLISAYLKEKKSATVTELSGALYVSEATVRRDLNKMHAMGMIERSHGGAVFIDNTSEVSIFVRQEKNTKEKQRTAEIALRHIPAFDSVFIDNSSTCLALAERMNLSRKIVVTNGLQVAMTLSQKESVTLILPGGELHYNTTAMTGGLALQTLSNFRFDLMLSSCAGIDETGSYENSLETMLVKRKAFEQSRERILLADRTKFGDVPAYRTENTAAYDAVVTDASDEAVAGLRAAGIRVFNN